MLDKFLEVSYEHETHNSLRNEMARHLKKLPFDELAKIASGEVKLADSDSADWLEKFRDTPFYDQALALEEEYLKADISDQQMQQQNRSVYDAKDAIRLKKRMLEMQFLQAQATPLPGAGAEGALPPPGLTQEPSPEPAGAPTAAGMGTPVGAEAKTAAILTEKARDKIKPGNFAVKSKGGEEKYPIHDEAHARNALVRVRQFGSSSEKAKVYSAVSKKYPALSTRSEVIPEKTQHKAERKLGLPSGGESQKKEGPKQKVSCGASCKTAEADKLALKLGLITSAGKAAKETGKEVAKKVGEIAKTSSVPDSVIASMRMSLVTKTAEVAPPPELNALAAADIWGRQMAKEAAPGVLGAMWGGLKGAANYMKGTPGAMLEAAKKGGGQLGTMAKETVTGAGQAAGKWIKKNPMAAAGIGAGAVGGTALGAGALGHHMGQQQ